jgi:hypothetical protein
MNIVNTEEGKGFLVELKYCERCGGLFLRARGSGAEYCGGCQTHVDELPRRAERTSRKDRASRRGDLAGGAPIGSLLGVAEMEVRV